VSDGLQFTVQTDDGPVRAVLTTAAMRTLSGRSHVAGSDLLSIYEYELQEVVRKMVREQRRHDVYRIHATDL
jgi:hypothetical protein